MMRRSMLSKLAWLNKTLSSGKYSVDELRKEWKQHSGKNVSERALFRWIDELEKKENLSVDNINGKYHIYDAEKWIANTTKINNLIGEHEDIKDKFLIDNIPSENHFLEIVLDAIRSNSIVRFSYKSYSDPNSRDPEIKKKVIHPYCVKRFENRWYVIGFCVTSEGKEGVEKVNAMRTFSLDMMSELKVFKKKFKPDPNFDAAKYFEDVYGITTGDNGPLTEIRISVDSWLANYLRTLPLHPSQKDVGGGTSFNVFQYTLRPANDFYQALLHHGSHLEVRSPESVRNKMKELIQEMAKKYGMDIK